jgi:hypothetical protein
VDKTRESISQVIASFQSSFNAEDVEDGGGKTFSPTMALI